MPNVTSDWPTPAVGPQQTSRPITLLEELERLKPGSVVRVTQDLDGIWSNFAEHFMKRGRDWSKLDGEGEDDFGSPLDDAYILAHAVVHGRKVGSITVIWDAAATEAERGAAAATPGLSMGDLARQNAALVADARAAGERLMQLAAVPPQHHVTLQTGVDAIVRAHGSLTRDLHDAKARIAELEADPSASHLPDADAITWTSTDGTQHVALRTGGAWLHNGSSQTEAWLIDTMRLRGGVPRALDLRSED